MTALRPQNRSWMFAFVVVAWIGCGGETGPSRSRIEGLVKLDGTPIPEGTINLVPIGQTKGPTASAQIKEGVYQSEDNKGPVAGTYRVEILAYRAGKATSSEGIPGATSGPSAASSAPQVEMYIPSKFNATSELTFEVTAGVNKKDFELKSK